MKRATLWAFASAALHLSAILGSAEARIGETFEECTKRYGGEPFEEPVVGGIKQDRGLMWEVDGIVVECRFAGKDKVITAKPKATDVCVSVTYVSHQEFNDKEIEVLLQKNESKKKWMFIRRLGAWITEDESLFAYHANKTVVIKSVDNAAKSRYEQDRKLHQRKAREFKGL